jgi:hypothetical protein
MDAPMDWWQKLATDPNATFTAAVAAFTFALVVVGAWQARRLRQTVELTREDVAFNYRPKLRVRNVVVTQLRPVHGAPSNLFEKGHFIQGQLFVVNVGGRPAEIVESHCETFYTDKAGLPMERPYEGKDGNNFLGKSKLAPGEPITGVFTSEKPLGDEAADIQSLTQGCHLYVLGWIEYRDDRAIIRRTAFCRHYRVAPNQLHPRFYPVDDPDYEHEE